AALWFGVLKPAVEGTARDAVAGPLAKQSAAVAQLQRQTAGGAAAAPGAGQSPAPTAQPAAGTGASFARRLDNSGGGRNQYRVREAGLSGPERRRAQVRPPIGHPPADERLRGLR